MQFQQSFGMSQNIYPLKCQNLERENHGCQSLTIIPRTTQMELVGLSVMMSCTIWPQYTKVTGRSDRVEFVEHRQRFESQVLMQGKKKKKSDRHFCTGTRYNHGKASFLLHLGRSLCGYNT